jgi:DNA polymerase III alpha subunit
LPYGEGEYFVLSFKPRITKTGKRMATLVVADSNRELISAVVFPTVFAMAYTRIEEGQIFPMEFGETKEGDTTLKEVSNAK